MDDPEQCVKQVASTQLRNGMSHSINTSLLHKNALTYMLSLMEITKEYMLVYPPHRLIGTVRLRVDKVLKYVE